MIKVIAIDDHPLMLAKVVEEINRAGDMHIVGAAKHGTKMLPLAREKSPDVVILDLSMDIGVFEPVSAVQQLLRERPDTKVLILTANISSSYIHDLTKAGVLGYLLKSDDMSIELATAVRTICSGQRFLSPAVTDVLLAGNETPGKPALNERELQVLRLTAEGLQNEQIAQMVGVSGKWVRNILSEIYRKMAIPDDVNQRVVAVNKAHELGLLGKRPAREPESSGN